MWSGTLGTPAQPGNPERTASLQQDAAETQCSLKGHKDSILKTADVFDLSLSKLLTVGKLCGRLFWVFFISLRVLVLH